MYETLIYEDNLAKDTAEEIEWRPLIKDGVEYDVPAIKSFLFKKDRVIYSLEQKYFNKLPIRVNSTQELVTKSGKVVQRIKNDGFSSFAIIPEKIYSFRMLINCDGITHSNHLDWQIWKIICWCSRIARINLRLSACSGWGKSSYLKVLNFLLDKCYVLPRPKTIPGICKGITRDGVIALDEMGKLKSEVKQEIQSVLFQLGERDTVLKTGSAGSSAYRTKPTYKTENLSCICLFNRLQDYKEREDFFDFMFSNSQAINHRFLPLMPPTGYLDDSQFTQKNVSLTEDMEQDYRNIMKSFQYYYDLWNSGKIFEKEINMMNVRLGVVKIAGSKIKGRHLESFENIACFLYLYAEGNMEEYLVLLSRLFMWYTNYLDMVKNPDFVEVSEELIQ